MKQKKLSWGKYWPLVIILIVFFSSLMWEHRKASLESVPVTKVDFAMDTVIQYCFYGENAQKALEECESLLLELEGKFTCSETYGSGKGEILQVNQMAGKKAVPVSPETFQLLLRSLELREQTSGLFDVTIGPLTALWNIMGDSPSVPPQEEIETALSLVGEGIFLEQDKQEVYLQREGQRIDLGAVAKGCACDLLREVCQKNGIVKGYLSLGGNMMVLPDSKEMRFGLQNPLNGGEASAIATFSLEGQTMATAGGYERYFEQNGVRYCHILDPRTGWPAQTDLLSASVISEDGALADALSTALFLMGREKALAFLENVPCHAVLVDSDRQVWLYGDIEEKFQFQLLESSGYRLAE